MGFQEACDKGGKRVIFMLFLVFFRETTAYVGRDPGLLERVARQKDALEKRRFDI